MIFDLTFLDKNRLYDTERFLMKLNEFRNNLTTVIDRPVIMILPQALKELFITYAQDTWSIRTTIATIYLKDYL
ncbi:MAG TPA: hypothetical protein EYH01_00415 [Campylobacterales bacterium]|nr:hypothetical protein [Campylobacterales bacterium]